MYRNTCVLEKKFQHLHGVVPPLKNVRRRRFRKTLRKKLIDLASIEKEVKRLLRADLEAEDVKAEEIADDDNGGGLTLIFTCVIIKSLDLTPILGHAICTYRYVKSLS